MKSLLILVLLIILSTNAYSQRNIKNEWERQALSLGIIEDDLIQSEKNPAVAFIFGLAAPGMGQMYNEQLGLGFGLFIGTGVLMAYSQESTGEKREKILIAGGIVWFISAIAAPFTSQSINREVRTKRAIKEKIREQKSTGMLNNIRIQPYYDGQSGGLSIGYSW